MKDIKKNCKFFRQHYNCSKHGHISNLDCGHCVNDRKGIKRSSCKNCPYYEQDKKHELKALYRVRANRIFIEFGHLIRKYNQLCEETKNLTEE